MDCSTPGKARLILIKYSLPWPTCKLSKKLDTLTLDKVRLISVSVGYLIMLGIRASPRLVSLAASETRKASSSTRASCVLANRTWPLPVTCRPRLWITENLQWTKLRYSVLVDTWNLTASGISSWMCVALKTNGASVSSWLLLGWGAIDRNVGMALRSMQLIWQLNTRRYHNSLTFSNVRSVT